MGRKKECCGKKGSSSSRGSRCEDNVGDGIYSPSSSEASNTKKDQMNEGTSMSNSKMQEQRQCSEVGHTPGNDDSSLVEKRPLEMKYQHHNLRSRTKRLKALEKPPTPPPEEIIPKAESPDTKPEKKIKRWEAWSQLDVNTFFVALNECGRDFEAIQKYISRGHKRRGLAPELVRTKEQVRHLYYRTCLKLNKKNVEMRKDLKRIDAELHAVINYGEFRRKLKGTPFKWDKLSELIQKGCTVVRIKGKNQRIKTPENCKTLQTMLQIDNSSKLRPQKLPATATVELRPLDNATWCAVQSLAYNPRMRVSVPLQKDLATLIRKIACRLLPEAREHSKHLSEEEREPSNLEFSLPANTTVSSYSSVCGRYWLENSRRPVSLKPEVIPPGFKAPVEIEPEEEMEVEVVHSITSNSEEATMLQDRVLDSDAAEQAGTCQKNVSSKNSDSPLKSQQSGPQGAIVRSQKRGEIVGSTILVPSDKATEDIVNPHFVNVALHPGTESHLPSFDAKSNWTKSFSPEKQCLVQNDVMLSSANSDHKEWVSNLSSSGRCTNSESVGVRQEVSASQMVLLESTNGNIDVLQKTDNILQVENGLALSMQQNGVSLVSGVGEVDTLTKTVTLEKGVVPRNKDGGGDNNDLIPLEKGIAQLQETNLENKMVSDNISLSSTCPSGSTSCRPGPSSCDLDGVTVEPDLFLNADVTEDDSNSAASPSLEGDGVADGEEENEVTMQEFITKDQYLRSKLTENNSKHIKLLDVYLMTGKPAKIKFNYVFTGKMREKWTRNSLLEKLIVLAKLEYDVKSTKKYVSVGTATSPVRETPPPPKFQSPPQPQKLNLRIDQNGTVTAPILTHNGQLTCLINQLPGLVTSVSKNTNDARKSGRKEFEFARPIAPAPVFPKVPNGGFIHTDHKLPNGTILNVVPQRFLVPVAKKPRKALGNENINFPSNGNMPPIKPSVRKAVRQRPIFPVNRVMAGRKLIRAGPANLDGTNQVFSSKLVGGEKGQENPANDLLMQAARAASIISSPAKNTSYQVPVSLNQQLAYPTPTNSVTQSHHYSNIPGNSTLQSKTDASQIVSGTHNVTSCASTASMSALPILTSQSDDNGLSAVTSPEQTVTSTAELQLSPKSSKLLNNIGTSLLATPKPSQNPDLSILNTPTLLSTPPTMETSPENPMDTSAILSWLDESIPNTPVKSSAETALPGFRAQLKTLSKPKDPEGNLGSLQSIDTSEDTSIKEDDSPFKPGGENAMLQSQDESSLSSLFGHLQTPEKNRSQSSTSFQGILPPCALSENSRDSIGLNHDVDSQFNFMLNENSLDFTKKFEQVVASMAPRGEEKQTT